MPKLTRRKVGQVLLTARADGLWRASWHERATGRYMRRKLPFTDWADVLEAARAINAEVATGAGFTPKLRGGDTVTVADALAEAIAHTGASERTRLDYAARGNRFMDWLRAHRPGVAAWADIDERTVGDFIEYLRADGLAHDSQRLCLFVIRSTARYMARTRAGICRDVTAGLRLRQGAASKGTEGDGCILSPELLRELLVRLKRADPMVSVWATMQGLTGCRMFEACYMTEGDIDFTAGTLGISSNSAHAVKTAASARTIPMPKPVADALRAWILALKVRHPEGYLFHPTRERSGRGKAALPETRVGAFTMDTVRHRWGDALKVAIAADKAKGIPALKLPKGFTARMLRGSFITAMRAAGIDSDVLRKYVGHSPASVMAKHYDRIDLDRLRPIAELAEQLASGTGAFARKAEQQLKTGAGLH